MSRRNRKEDAKGIFPEVMRTRSDLVSAELVEKGIALQEIGGTRYAAAYLRSRRIRLNVALRVLARPSQRRNYNSIADY